VSISGVVGVLCTRQLRVSGLLVVIAGNALGEGGAELVGGGGHEDAGSEELGERCGDAGSGGQDQVMPPMAARIVMVVIGRGPPPSVGIGRVLGCCLSPGSPSKGASSISVRAFGVRLQQC
jgi:hypothetical protein